jgi:CRISPR/Cas system-associated exonuclease Cas4 (RecB family)
VAGRTPRWTSASDLAEYAYCPRAGYYRRHRAPPAPTVESEAGVAYHARELARAGALERRAGIYWGGLLAGSIAIGVGLLVLLRP